MSRNYHNMAARYNCYFLAKERMLVVEDKIYQNHTDDYNYILHFFPPLDTNLSSSLQTDLDYIYNKAKLPINKHKNSNWVAPSYNIIGKSKWLGNKMDSSIYVHKYVIARVSDIEGKQLAQINLLRTYVSQNDFRSADDEYLELSKQKIAEENQKDYSLACLEYLYRLRDFEAMLPHLETLVPIVKKKDLRSRLYFIQGQIHQRLGNDKIAYKAYKKSMKRNPPYEIEFNAKLNISQVSNIESKDQLKKTNKRFDKMIKDDKNENYLSRIYYERGKFELKQNKLSKGVHFLNKSLEAPGTPEEQKAYAYLLLGQLHYNDIDTLPTKVDKYKTSKLYYDSTVTSMNTFFEDASNIIERQLILTNFVDQLEIVEKERQLQNWATLSPEELQQEVEKQMALDKKKLEREAAIQKRKEQEAKKAKAAGENNVNTPQFSQGGYFAYDPISVASQKLKFQQQWGDRKLEDNWRRSDKDEISNEDTTNESSDTSLSLANRKDSTHTKSGEKAADIIKLESSTYTQGIPNTPEKLNASNTKLIEATYKLGKIYYYDLLEIDNAREVFESYIKNHPDTKYEAEVIYFLYLICNKTAGCDSKKYKNLEKRKYPNSLFYKLMENEDYLAESEELNKASHLSYEQAYNLFKNEQFLSSRKLLAQLKTKYPKTDILDKIEFMHVSTYAYTDQLSKYYYGLEQFIKNFGTSPLRHKAREILDRKPENIKATDKVESKFYRNDSIPHVFVAIFKPEQMPYSEIDRIYNEFRHNHYRGVEFNTKKVDFSDSTYLLSNKPFSNYNDAKTYYDKLMHHHEFGRHLDKVDYSYYLVTEQNYKTLIATRNINGFADFYRQQYGIIEE